MECFNIRRLKCSKIVKVFNILDFHPTEQIGNKRINEHYYFVKFIIQLYNQVSQDYNLLSDNFFHFVITHKEEKI